MSRASFLRLATIFTCLALAAPVKAQQYSFRYYGTEDGLTNAAVKVLFQDRTGFVWAGTENGVSATMVSGFSVTGQSRVFHTISS